MQYKGKAIEIVGIKEVFGQRISLDSQHSSHTRLTSRTSQRTVPSLQKSMAVQPHSIQRTRPPKRTTKAHTGATRNWRFSG